MSTSFPPYAYRPKFNPSPAPCVLKSFNEDRGRLLIGGSFFRSYDAGSHVNDITVACSYISDIYSGNPFAPVINDTRTVTARVTLTEGAAVETYDAVQVQTYLSVEDPPTVFTDMWVWTSSAIPSLRSQLNSSLIVTMPTVDIIGNGTRSAPTPWASSTDDDDHIATFGATFLIGGSGPPANPDSVYGTVNEIRTGPIRSMVHIGQSESNQPTGSYVEIGEIKEYNGTTWITYATAGGGGGGGGGGGSSEFLALAGGSMAGALILFANPTAALEAATKQYVDAGDTSTLAAVATHAGDAALHLTSTQNTLLDGLAGTLTATELNYVDGVTSSIQPQLNNKLDLSGGTMTGALTLSADPTTSLHAATRQYVDAVATGLDIKASVRVATTTTLPAYTAVGSGVGKTLTANANGALVIDGVNNIVNTNRILIKNEATSHLNHGIYVVTNAGSPSTQWILTRATDADGSPANEVTAGMFTFVEEGTVNVGSGWVLVTNNPISIDTTALQFSRFSNQIVAASAVTVVPTGNISSSDVQAAIQELDNEKIAKAGDTMTGTLTLNADPALALQAATKQYVDSTGAVVSGDALAFAIVFG